MVERLTGEVRPHRVLDGLAASGYSPESAICDIVDNSVTYGASNIRIRLDRDPGLGENRLNNARRYAIADDGTGMDRDGLMNALALGSADFYPEGALSKFGLGLKAAAFSQGKRLTVTTRTADGPLLRATVDRDEVERCGEYVIDLEELGQIADDELWQDLQPKAQSGTIVVIDAIKAVNHPSVKATREALIHDLGRVYQFFLQDDRKQLRISVDGPSGPVPVQAFDPLFIQEADESRLAWQEASPITTGQWDGRTTEWLKFPDQVLLDPLTGATGILEITQLPHPPSFGLANAKGVRDKYSVGAGEYGVYVYRNGRMISKADRFDGLIPQDQHFYAFRARLKIDQSADDALNIDLKKSRILLSEAARNALDDVLAEPKRQARESWAQAGARIKEEAGMDPDSQVGDLLAEIRLPDDLPTDATDQAADSDRTKRGESDRARRTIEKTPDAEPNGEPPNDLALPGESRRPGGGRVLFVPILEDNVVWERAYDPALGVVARINANHRFIREIRARFKEPVASFLLQAIFVSLANGEAHAVRSVNSIPMGEVDAVLSDLRESVSATLSKIMQDVAEDLDRIFT